MLTGSILLALLWPPSVVFDAVVWWSRPDPDHVFKEIIYGFGVYDGCIQASLGGPMGPDPGIAGGVRNDGAHFGLSGDPINLTRVFPPPRFDTDSPFDRVVSVPIWALLLLWLGANFFVVLVATHTRSPRGHGR